MVRARKVLRVESLEDRQLMAADANVRTYDGTGNNLKNTELGSTGEDFLRRGVAEYGDGISSLAGADRPSAREISNAVLAQSGSVVNSRWLSDMIWQWGQFVDHDLDLTLSATPTESAPIAVPTGDPYFDPAGSGTQTIGLSRSLYDPSTGTSTSNQRQQVNSITAWIDGSMIYGSDAATAASLREGTGGRMKTSEGNLLPQDATGFFQAGDIRVNEQVGLISMQTLFVREHNRLASEIAKANPKLTDEQVFQKARAIVIGEVEAITYREFLPALLGQGAIAPYQGYNPQVNPDVGNVFATAAYRFGHSMLSSTLLRLNNDGTPIAGGSLALRDAFFNPSAVEETGISPILKGLATQRAQELDSKVIDDVRNFLFGPPGAGGFDLASLNIQRGRDHGLADYNQTRADYGLKKVASFAEITKDPAVQAALKAEYGTVDNIDAWVGALAEDHLPGSSVGPLVQRVLVDQFLRVRDGDRFWYERSLTGNDLKLVESTTLADVIRRNTDITNLQKNVFFTPDAAQNAPPKSPTSPATKPQAPLPPPPPPIATSPAPTGGTTSSGSTSNNPPPPPPPPAPPSGSTTSTGSTTTTTPPPRPLAPPPPPPAPGGSSTNSRPAAPPAPAPTPASHDAVFSSLGSSLPSATAPATGGTRRA